MREPARACVTVTVTEETAVTRDNNKCIYVVCVSNIYTAYCMGVTLQGKVISMFLEPWLFAASHPTKWRICTPPEQRVWLSLAK